MKCPICPEADLVMTDRQGVEIDYCPKCRGVWLDRGELDKIIERSMALTMDSPSQNTLQPGYAGGRREPSRHDAHHHKHHEHYDRRRSWLRELFD